MSKEGLFKNIGTALAAVALVTSVACGAPPQKSIAGFEVVSLNVVPSEVSIGKEAKITAKVVNVGESQATYTAALTINDVESQKKDVVIPAEDIGIVTFSVVKREAGTYRFAIDDLTASLSVSDPIQEIRSAWESFEPLANLGLALWEYHTYSSQYPYNSSQRHLTEYKEQLDARLAKVDVYLGEVGNQELREKWTAVSENTTFTSFLKCRTEFYNLYCHSLEVGMNDLRSSLSMEQNGIAKEELRAAWESMEPLAQIDLLVAENTRDSYLVFAGEITQSDYSTRTATVMEKIDASLDKLDNKDFTKKFTKAWFESSGAESAKLNLECFELYESFFHKATEDFTQELGQN
ncbi:MAG: hypothetical protein JSV54_06775 [Chloroflexota bacterium]|nr:MAG: hypothetical protein JSV54_06775 [Chloroflexota bacterium]